MKRVEDLRLIKGLGVFVGDLSLPKMLHCAFVHGSYAHAKILRIDYSEALKTRGVIAVLDGRDVASRYKPLSTFISGMNYYGIAVDKVRYYGEPVAMVLADSVETAYDAAEKIYVDYEPLPAVVDPEESVHSNTLIHEGIGTNLVLHRSFRFGDVDRALREADVVVSEKFYFDRYAASPIETCGVLVDYNKDGSLIVYDNQQTPYLFRNIIARSLGIEPDKLRFIEKDIGGGFGVKIMLYPYVFLICAASLHVKRPVKWLETRTEHLMAMAQNSNRVVYAEMALDKTGKITGYRTMFYEDCGAFVRPPDPGGAVRSLMAYQGCYDIRNIEVDLNIVVTNKCPTGPVRGYGCPQAFFVLERMIDIAAQELGISPVEIRLKNMIDKSQQPYKNVFGSLYDGGDYKAVLRKAVELAETEKYASMPSVGIGIACVVEPAVTNLARNKLLFPSIEMSGSGEGAIVRLEESGNVTVVISSIPQGQGHETVATYIAARTLGVRPENIRVLHGDTDIVYPSPYGGTWASRFSVMTVAAVKKACEALRKKILEIAAVLLEVSPDDLELQDGILRVRDGSASMTLAQFATKVFRDNVRTKDVNDSLQAAVYYEYPTFNTGEVGEINMSATYGNSAHVAVVKVDPETYEITLLRYVAVHDCGKILNKEIVEGQVLGGIVQGLGATLYENIVYDENGILLTSTLADYLLPTSVEVPEIILDYSETPSMFSETGAKGMGEGPAIPVAAAIINAVEKAVKVRINRSYITPALLWMLVNESKG